MDMGSPQASDQGRGTPESPLRTLARAAELARAGDTVVLKPGVYRGRGRLFVPKDSPMKGAGKDGADIGATVLYRYRDGALTNEALWDPRTGEFPHGAVVAGINDVPGSSCFDVHQRLNVSPATLPAGYGH